MLRLSRVFICSALVTGVVALGLAPGADAPGSPPDFKPYTEKVGEASFDMVPIPGGTFMMGRPESEKGRSPDEGPQFKVQVGPFWMEKTETTWDLYDIYWKDENIVEGDKRRTAADGQPEPVVTKDALTRPTPPYSDETFGHGREGKPVLAITHHAALMYCEWLSRKTGKHYRLPTEAEWEYACRAGSTTAYPFGDDPSKLGDYAWYGANAEEDTHEVGKKKPNAWGLHDMLGNVGEWCMDHYSPTDYQRYKGPELTLNPVRKPDSFKYSYVVRGGSWADPDVRCRSAARRGSDKNWLKRDPQRPQSIWWMTDADFVGFRVVRPVTEIAELKDFLPPVNWQSKDNAEKQ
jgi:formylglycine-generating enzyme required for sulfatase activity